MPRELLLCEGLLRFGSRREGAKAGNELLIECEDAADVHLVKSLPCRNLAADKVKRRQPAVAFSLRGVCKLDCRLPSVGLGVLSREGARSVWPCRERPWAGQLEHCVFGEARRGGFLVGCRHGAHEIGDHVRNVHAQTVMLRLTCSPARAKTVRSPEVTDGAARQRVRSRRRSESRPFRHCRPAAGSASMQHWCRTR